MSKKTLVILLIAVVLVGSIFDFYGTNLLFSDIGNLYAGFKDNYIFSTIPMMMIFSQFILGVIYLSRMIVRPQYKKAMTKKFLITLAAMSLVGLVFSIISGISVYHSFTKPYPFPLYCLVMTIVNVVFIASAIYALILVKKRMSEDVEKRKFNILYVIYTFIASILLWISLDRFGAFLYLPSYIQWSTFDLSWPFIFGLPILLSMMVQSFLYAFDFYNTHPKYGVMYAVFNLLVGFILGFINIKLYYRNSSLIAAISLPMGLERLSTSNSTTKVLFILVCTMGLIGLGYSIYFLIKSKKK